MWKNAIRRFMTQLLRGEMQQVRNGDRKQCLHENKSMDNCVKHAILLVSAAGDGQKAATNSDDVGFSAKRISTLKGHSDLCVHDCINHQIDVSESRCRMRQHSKDFHHKSANYRNRWSLKTSSLRCLVQLPLQIDSVSKMQIAQTGWNERQITQSCTFSTVVKVLRLYLLCPCQPLLRRDCFDKRAQRGFMCLFQSYCECKHCQPCKDTQEAPGKTVLNKK